MLRRPTATSGPDANTGWQLSGSPLHGAARNASRSLTPGRAAARIACTHAEQREAPHSKIAIWSALENVRSPDRGLVSAVVASNTVPDSPARSRSVSTKNAGAKIAGRRPFHSSAWSAFQPTTPIRAPAPIPIWRSASSRFGPPPRSIPIRLNVGHNTTSTSIGTTGT